MIADSDHPHIRSRGLAGRLRDLREQQGLTQKQAAQALSGTGALSVATISLWEKPGSDRLPPVQRLAAYARLFCTHRSFASGAPRLLPDEELTAEEHQVEAELHAELLALREQAQPTGPAGPFVSAPPRPPFERSPVPQDSIWHFPDGQAVSIVCSDAVDPPAYASPAHLNYSQFARHADLDALIQVYGQARADNPEGMIRILPPEELRKDFALNHLIIIGGVAVHDTDYFSQDIPLPTAPATGDTHVFKCTVDGETREFASVSENGTVLYDVGLIARRPHPIVPQRTVTMLFGITSRGVHGAALAFIDSHVKETNELYLREAFGNTEAFCVIMRVPVRNNVALPPNLWDENVRLYEWSPDTGARW
jgi:transcriptional regulator with XRE-family HTH domain